MNDYLLLFLLIMIIPISAQIYVSATYGKYRKIPNKFKLTGYDVARKILDKNGLNNVYIVKTGGRLSDHYDSSRKTIRLSNEIYDGDSMAAIAVAAHEVGHAIQDKDGYAFMRIRQAIAPTVSIGEKFSIILLLVGFFLQIVNLIWLAIIIMVAGLAFQIITLPVEFDASKRAKAEIDKHNLADQKSMDGIRAMLKAAAMTYVAAVLASILQILRLVLIITDRR